MCKDGMEKRNAHASAMVVDGPGRNSFDDGGLGRIMEGGYASVLRRTAYADHFHVGILDWSTLVSYQYSPGRSVYVV